MSDPSLERVASTLSPSLSWVCLMSEAGIRTAKLFPHLDIWIFMKNLSIIDIHQCISIIVESFLCVQQPLLTQAIDQILLGVAIIAVRFGEVAEWSNVPDSKSGKDESPSWVQIPPSPPIKGLLSVILKRCL